MAEQRSDWPLFGPKPRHGHRRPPRLHAGHDDLLVQSQESLRVAPTATRCMH